MTYEIYSLETLSTFTRPQLWAICQQRGIKKFPKSSDCVQAILDAQPQLVVQGDDDERGSGRNEVEFVGDDAIADGAVIATIKYDDSDFITQRWVVIIGGNEAHRANTAVKAQGWVIYHYKNGTLPVVAPQPEAKPELPCSLPAASKSWNLQASQLNIAVCPKCDGYGCGACSYSGVKNIDSCQPVDNYRLKYVESLGDMISYLAYNDTKFLSMVFRVRNRLQVWENEVDTYYWQVGSEAKYSSSREALEALENKEIKVNVISKVEAACDDFGLQVWEENDAIAIYDGEVKLGEIGCINDNWWQAKSTSVRRSSAESVIEAVLMLWLSAGAPLQALVEQSEGSDNKPQLLEVSNAN